MKKQDIKKLICHFESLSNDLDQGYTSSLSDYASDDDKDDRELTVKKIDFPQINHFASVERLSENKITEKTNLTEKCNKLKIENERLNKEYNDLQKHTELLQADIGSYKEQNEKLENVKFSMLNKIKTLEKHKSKVSMEMEYFKKQPIVMQLDPNIINSSLAEDRKKLLRLFWRKIEKLN